MKPQPYYSLNKKATNMLQQLKIEKKNCKKHMAKKYMISNSCALTTVYGKKIHDIKFMCTNYRICQKTISLT